MADRNRAVHIHYDFLARERHPIRAARLLFSAPSWVLTGPIYLIAIITFSSIGYSFWATKDQLVMAPMRLERETITIQSVGGGIVSRIQIPEGETVHVGTLLAEVQLTQVTSMTESESLVNKQSDLEEKVRVLEDEYNFNKKQLELSSVNIKKDQSVLRQQLSTAEDNVRFYQDKLGGARKAFQDEQKLFNSKDITKMEYDRAKAKVDDMEKSVRDAQAEVNKIRVSLAALSEDKLHNELKQLRERFKTQHTQLTSQLETARLQMSQADTFVRGVSQDGKMTTYKSAVDGLVTQVHVKQGGMITPGSPLFTIVKESAALQGRALVQNKDIGSIKKGQMVKIKYFAYPYQEFGIPEGRVIDIATKPGGPTGQESMYVVRVALEQESIAKKDGRLKPLEIGLEGIAEIKTGEKRLIELLFTPVSKFFTHPDE
ncbi:MAG: HlyD family efflux transporter periplasmic adaptor subunit [Magnetococcales bacterium]|nr:HlyD family efflux transporter periplasmic adaptor subunit [Magnetococcales bacterium]